MRRSALAAALLLPLSGGIAAADPAPPPAAGFCANCHGTDGRQRGAIPAIAGQPAAVIASKLIGFRADTVPEATVMPRLVKGLTDAEIEAVADYFSQIR